METKIPAWIRPENNQKLYISSARGWRDRDSFLTKCYAIDALEERSWMIYGRDAASPFVTIADNAANIDREWREKFYDKRVYQFINGSSIRVLDSAPAPIKIELSFSELVGEE